jgi:hypothetical protein
MAEISKQALKVENNTEFPNNNAGAITPSRLRTFNIDMIDSLVDEISYNVDSGSWNQQIDALEQFTASASGLTTGSLLVTASAVGNVITFRKGDSSTFNVTVATGSIPDISNLNQATASLQAFTASAQTSINNLNSTTASLNTSVTNINTFTASAAVSITNLNASSASQQTSINNLNGATGSYATTGSNTFTSANTFTSISASSFVSASEFIGNGSKLTGITASVSMPILDEGIPQGNAFSLNFTGSGISATVVGGTAIISVNTPDSGTLNNLTASFNAYTASTNADLAAIHQATASLQQFTASFSTSSLVTTSSFNAYTASNDQRVTSLEANTASVNTSITQLNANTASQQISIDALNVNSASVNTSITNVNSATASLFTSVTNINTFTQSAQISINALNAATSSYVTSAITASSLVTASFDNGTRNLTFTKGDAQTFSVNIPDVSGSSGNFATTGSNQFNGDQSISGSITLSGSINNVNYVDFNTASVTPAWKSGRVFWDNTDGCLGVYNAEADITLQVGQEMWVKARNNTGVTIANGAAVRLIGAQGDNPLIVLAQSVQVSGSAITDNQILGIATHAIETGTDGYVTTLGNVRGLNTSAYTEGQVLFVSSSAGLLTSVVPVAPYERMPVATVVKVGPGGSGILYVAPIPPIDFSTLSSVQIDGNYANDDVWIYEGNVWKHKSKSDIGLTTTSSFNAYTSSNDAKVNSLISATGSYATTGSNTFTANQTISNGGLLLMQTGSTINLFEGTGTSAIRFWSGSSVTEDTPRWVNMQPQPGGGGTLAISAFPENNHFVFFNPATWQTQFESVVTGYGTHSRLKIGSGIEVTGSTLLGGELQLFPTAASNNGSNAVLFVSASTVSSDSSNLYYNPSTNTLAVSASTGISNISPNTISFQSGSGAYGTYSTSISKNGFTSVIEGGNYIGMSGNPSKLGSPSLTSNTKPAILAISSSAQPYVAIELQASGSSFSDGRVTFPRNVAMLQNLEITGSLTASLQQGYVWVGNGGGRTTTVATSSFGGGGAAFPYSGTASISGSLQVTGSVSGLPITLSVAASTASIDMRAGNNFILDIPTATTTHIVPTNIIAGQTINLLLRQPVTSGSVAWSPLVLFPSGLDMVATATGSAIDLVSMISFDTTNLMAANVKNLK